MKIDKTIDETIPNLPQLQVSSTGQVSIKTNLEDFERGLKDFIQKINLEPQDDNEFTNLDKACKQCKEIEAKLIEADNAISEIVNIEIYRQKIKDLSATTRKVRIQAEKVIQTGKNQIKEKVMLEIKQQWNELVLAQKQTGLNLPVKEPDFDQSVKFVKSLDGYKKSLQTCFDDNKNNLIKLYNQAIINQKYIKDEYSHLFPDLTKLLPLPSAEFNDIVDNRIENEQKRLAEVKEEMKRLIEKEQEEKNKRELAEKQKLAEQQKVEEQQKADKAKEEIIDLNPVEPVKVEPANSIEKMQEQKRQDTITNENICPADITKKFAETNEVDLTDDKGVFTAGEVKPQKIIEDDETIKNLMKDNEDVLELSGTISKDDALYRLHHLVYFISELDNPDDVNKIFEWVTQEFGERFTKAKPVLSKTIFY